MGLHDSRHGQVPAVTTTLVLDVARGYDQYIESEVVFADATRLRRENTPGISSAARRPTSLCSFCPRSSSTNCQSPTARVPSELLEHKLENESTNGILMFIEINRHHEVVLGHGWRRGLDSVLMALGSVWKVRSGVEGIEKLQRHDVADHRLVGSSRTLALQSANPADIEVEHQLRAVLRVVKKVQHRPEPLS